MNATNFPQLASASAGVLDRLRSCLPQCLHGVGPDTPLSSLGLDSLDLVELLCALEAEFHVSITLEEFESVTTAGDLAALVHRKTG